MLSKLCFRDLNFFMTQVSQVFLSLLRALAEATRLKLILVLSIEELSVLELVSIFGQSQPRLSRHLKILAEAGLVDRFQDGAWVFYRVVRHGMGQKLLSALLPFFEPLDDEIKTRLQSVIEDRHKKAQAYFDQTAQTWDKTSEIYGQIDPVKKAISDYLLEKRFECGLDLGCGTGRLSDLLAIYTQKQIGIDLSHPMLNIARAKALGLGLRASEFLHGDIADTRLADASSDLILIHQVLHFLVEPEKALVEAKRLLSKEGIIIIADLAPHEDETLRTSHFHRRLGISHEDLLEMAFQAGLKIDYLVKIDAKQTEAYNLSIWFLSHAPYFKN